LSRDQASALAGCPLAGPAWHYPGGGWLSPAALASFWLAGPGIALHTDCAVAALRHTDAGRWQALDAAGRPTHEADVVVLAAAAETARLLVPFSDAPAWPWRRTRGQVSVVPGPAAAAAGLPRPTLPVASGGYMLRLPAALGGRPDGGSEGGLLCGATSQQGDEDPALRDADHRANLSQVATLTGADAVLPEEWFSAGGPLQGRVGWRLGCDDRLPVLGGVPLPAAALAGARRLEQPRHVPRVAGLYVLTALGSRGITWAPLLGEVLAAGITGTPLPVASSLLDAIDAARFVSRAARRPA
jgi:tRNA 5-methylaminomethyl-2-thiouridine biosynthesis bifunctional protein